MNGSAGKLKLSQDGFLEFSELTNLCAQDNDYLTELCFASHEKVWSCVINRLFRSHRCEFFVDLNGSTCQPLFVVMLMFKRQLLDVTN